MGKYFGTDGIRGLANVHPVTTEVAMRLGMAVGYYFSRRSNTKHARILIGKDTRISCYSLENALASGITAMGVDVLFSGPIPTPGIAYLTRGMRANAGVMISASHNAYHDNGIKIFSPEGFKLADEVEFELEAMMDDSELFNRVVTHKKIGRARRIDDAIGQYAVFLKEAFSKSISLEGLRIVVDCAHGAAYATAPKVFEELGAEVFVVGNTPNGFNINDNCGALHPEFVKEKVLLYKADIGIALDGDADRLILVDEKGRIVDGDHVMAICALNLKEKNCLSNNTVVTTVMSNLGLDICMEKQGIKVAKTQVGDRYVVDYMRNNGCNFGGEQSGHLIFLDSNPTGDGILSALRIIEIMLQKCKPLSELAKVMQTVPQVLVNVEVKEKKDFTKIIQIQTCLEQIKTELGNKGRVLLRYSGTENLLRIMIEGEEENFIQRQAEQLAALARIHL